MKENFIFNPSSLFSKKNHDNNEDVLLYTMVGYEDYFDNSGHARIENQNDTKKIFAQKNILKNGSTKYLIKLSNNNKLYNPISIYGLEEKKTFLDRICRSNKKFKEVNEKAFKWYIKFLNTKNISWLYNAEREIE